METGAQTESRFQNDAARYAAYLATPEGRLRLDLALDNLLEFLPKTSLRALDVGGGTGATAIRLAALGIHVTLVDCSAAMLDIAERAAIGAGFADRIALKRGDATSMDHLFDGAVFDLILCHNLLEFVDDPGIVLRGAARLLRGPSSILSVLVRNRAGEVLKSAIQAGDLDAAEGALTSECGQESLYGGSARLFTADEVRKMLEGESFRVIAQRGVRVVADYLPSKVARNDEYERILKLEGNLGSRPEFAAVARYTQSLASPGLEGNR